jgi:hypothetical protein
MKAFRSLQLSLYGKARFAKYSNAGNGPSRHLTKATTWVPAKSCLNSISLLTNDALTSISPLRQR